MPFQPDAPVLLFGPYRPPALRRGDRTHCLVRDATLSSLPGQTAAYPGRAAVPSATEAAPACWSRTNWPGRSAASQPWP